LGRGLAIKQIIKANPHFGALKDESTLAPHEELVRIAELFRWDLGVLKRQVSEPFVSEPFHVGRQETCVDSPSINTLMACNVDNVSFQRRTADESLLD
jgi:hypothetical protein